jgi:hypothetical protein
MSLIKFAIGVALILTALMVLRSHIKNFKENRQKAIFDDLFDFLFFGWEATLAELILFAIGSVLVVYSFN